MIEYDFPVGLRSQGREEMMQGNCVLRPHIAEPNDLVSERDCGFDKNEDGGISS
jgi:hypothetical protein